MIDIFLNPLSACNQFTSKAELESALLKIVECFKYMLVAINSNTVRLVYDDSIELRGAMAVGGNITSDINQVSNKDLVRQWFIFTKNRASRAASALCDISVTSDRREFGSIAGTIRREIAVGDAQWLSFGGRNLNEQGRLYVTYTDSPGRESIRNSAAIETFRIIFPRYERSSKHRREGYFAGGDWVSPMPLSDEVAQTVLMQSFLVGSDRYGRLDADFFRFIETHPGQNVFHGFLVGRNVVPQEALLAMNA